MRFVFSAIAILAVGACSNHPLQDDVTGYDTADIVRKIRCEAQDQIILEIERGGLTDHQTRVLDLRRKIREASLWQANNKSILNRIDKAMEEDEAAATALNAKHDAISTEYNWVATEVSALDQLKNSETDPQTRQKLVFQHKDAYARGLILQERAKAVDAEKKGLDAKRKAHRRTHDELLRSISIKLNETKYVSYKRELKEIIAEEKSSDHDAMLRRKLFAINNATLALKLDFKVTENNNSTATGGIAWPIHLGALSLSYKGSKEKGRAAQRVVDTISLFVELSDAKNLDCRQPAARPPQDGRARAYPITGNIGVGDFLNQYFRISNETSIVAGADKFTDTLTFTTKISGQINPSIEIKPVSPSLVKAGLDLSADRTDLHIVTLQVRPYTAPAAKDEGTSIIIKKMPEILLNVGKGSDGGPATIRTAH